MLADILTFDPGHPLVYNSVQFVGLFTLFFALHSVVARTNAVKKPLLLAFSLFVYYKFAGPAVALLVVIASSDYAIGRLMAGSKRPRVRNLLLALSLSVDVGCLGFFKYANFFLDTWFGLAHPGVQSPVLDLLAPVGISFYVFKTLSYIFDIHRETIDEPERDYLNYLLYVSFFPNILAGPISKARDFLPQVRAPIELDNSRASRAFFLILTGAFKKVFIADFLAMNFVDRVVQSPALFTGFENLMAAYGAAIRFYCDFSGYTDMMVGVALLLGYVLEPNFDRPYLAYNVTDFWRRWHITLSDWLREYLYLPMAYGFRSFGRLGALPAVMVTFFVSGLWHGPSWNYILWGCAHGLAICVDVLADEPRRRLEKVLPRKLVRAACVFVTFHFLCLSLVLFSCADVPTAAQMLGKIFTDTDFGVAGQWASLYALPLSALVLGYVLQFLPHRWDAWWLGLFTRLHWVFKAVVLALGILLIYQAVGTHPQPFIYLKF